MPYNPSETNQIPAIISGTTQNLLQSLKQIDDEKQKRDQAEGALVGILANPLSKRIATPELLSQFAKGSGDKRMGIVGLLSGNLKQQEQIQLSQMSEAARNILQTQSIAAEAPLRAAQTQNVTAEAKQREQPAPANVGQPVIHPLSGQPIGFYDHNGDPKYFPASADATADTQAATDPLIDPTTSKAVPNKGIVRKTGAVVDTRTGKPVLETDPTGAFYFDQKGDPHPVPPGTILAKKVGELPQDEEQQGFFKKLVGGIFGGNKPAAVAGPNPAIEAEKAKAAAAIAAGAPADAVNARLADKLKTLGATP